MKHLKVKKIMKRIILLILLIMSLSVAGCSAQNGNSTADNLEITFFKIGSADSILLSDGSQTVLIDTGEEEDGEEIIDYLESERIETIDYLVITHFDKDHVGGADTVLNEVDVQNVLVPDYETDSTDYQEFLTAMEDNNLAPTVLTKKLSFSNSSASFTIYPPELSSYESDNDYSLVVSVEHGENRFLFAGDAEAVRLEELMNQLDGEYTLLKVPHHGRYSENSTDFFTKVSPEYAIITSSDKNKEEVVVVSALEKLGTTVYLTREGNVQVISDGETIQVTQ
ncbi:hypothetical protein BKP56_02660 [Marinilactibacillus sp. 15R]|uniref:ComEC/Rec2 family competence protein n=1 Tax=Marinilactibacillus sp. 15R TaxID=1911586 RepID=UPI00090A7D70|nr:MBL fold metallo-hydrolase [Marinilactibacillus sp. 15R]API88269.1 hypothetical protein BKP56_02660 [Marinilactibacillus sp. 15R]